MEKNVIHWIYKLALFICTYMLTNFAIGSEQLKLYLAIINEKAFSFIHKTKKLFYH